MTEKVNPLNSLPLWGKDFNWSPSWRIFFQQLKDMFLDDISQEEMQALIAAIPKPDATIDDRLESLESEMMLLKSGINPVASFLAVDPIIEDVSTRAFDDVIQNTDDCFRIEIITVRLYETGTGVTRITSADSPYTVSASDEIIFCDTDGGAITVNLPAGVPGRRLKIINCGSSGNTLTVNPYGTQQIYKSGAGTGIILIDGEVADIDFDTTEDWF